MNDLIHGVVLGVVISLLLQSLHYPGILKHIINILFLDYAWSIFLVPLLLELQHNFPITTNIVNQAKEYLLDSNNVFVLSGEVELN